MNSPDSRPWLLTLEASAEDHPSHLFPIRNDDLTWAREAVEFLSNCFAKEMADV